MIQIPTGALAAYTFYKREPHTWYPNGRGEAVLQTKGVSSHTLRNRQVRLEGSAASLPSLPAQVVFKGFGVTKDHSPCLLYLPTEHKDINGGDYRKLVLSHQPLVITPVES